MACAMVSAGIGEGKGVFQRCRRLLCKPGWRNMTKTESDETPLTMSVPEAGKKLGISRDSAYAAAERGEIPTIEKMLDIKPTVPSDAA